MHEPASTDETGRTDTYWTDGTDRTPEKMNGVDGCGCGLDRCPECSALDNMSMGCGCGLDRCPECSALDRMSMTERKSLRAAEMKIQKLERERQCLREKVSFLRKLDYTASEGDVTVVLSDSQTIKAHKLVLASRSPVFRRMLESDMRERSSGEIHIVDAPAAVMQALVQFLYTADINFSEEATPTLVYKAAEKYDIPELSVACESEMLKSVSFENLSEMLRLSFKHGLPRLQIKAALMFKENFDKVYLNIFGDLC